MLFVLVIWKQTPKIALRSRLWRNAKITYHSNIRWHGMLAMSAACTAWKLLATACKSMHTYNAQMVSGLSLHRCALEGKKNAVNQNET